jgi:Na+-transporting methylmalonyl-CoA/oxaloacetate decarboxylase gamma subunit
MQIVLRNIYNFITKTWGLIRIVFCHLSILVTAFTKIGDFVVEAVFKNPCIRGLGGII